MAVGIIESYDEILKRKGANTNSKKTPFLTDYVTLHLRGDQIFD